MLLLIGLENLGIGTDLRAHRGGQHGPSVVFFRIIQGLNFDHKAIAGLQRYWGRLGWPSALRPPRGAGVSHDAIVDGMIPPGLGPAASSSRPPVLILCKRRCGICLTGKPAGLDTLDVLGDGARFLLLRSGIGLRLLLGQLTRMHHAKAHLL
jgi:hypothetical protein